MFAALNLALAKELANPGHDRSIDRLLEQAGLPAAPESMMTTCYMARWRRDRNGQAG